MVSLSRQESVWTKADKHPPYPPSGGEASEEILTRDQQGGRREITELRSTADVARGSSSSNVPVRKARELRQLREDGRLLTDAAGEVEAGSGDSQQVKSCYCVRV